MFSARFAEEAAEQGSDLFTVLSRSSPESDVSEVHPGQPEVGT